MNIYVDGMTAREDFEEIGALISSYDDLFWDAGHESPPDAALLWIDEPLCVSEPSWFGATCFEIGQLSASCPAFHVASDVDLARSYAFVGIVHRADARVIVAPTVPRAVEAFCRALYAEMPYRQYLQTRRWKRIRYLARERAGERCQLCNASAVLHVHHRTYERRGYERDDDLIVLCAHCHAKFHDKLPKGGA